MITVSDMVSLETPPKNDAAPMRAKAPGSIHAQYGLFSGDITPNMDTIVRPIRRPYKAPIYLENKEKQAIYEAAPMRDKVRYNGPM